MLERLPFLSVLLTAVPTSQPLSTVLGSSGCSEPSCALWGGAEGHHAMLGLRGVHP